MVDVPQDISFVPNENDFTVLTGGAFAVSLIYVSYAYNGWNAATYLTDELEEPQRNLPKILVIGTLLVLVVYVALNFIFLYSTPIELLKGKIEIGYIVAQSIFGELGAKLTGVVMALLLVSTVSAMTLAGPRVIQVIAQDFSVFKWFSVLNKSQIPARAVYFQSAMAILFVMTSSFESILLFSGFALALNNFFAVFGIFVLRYRQPNLPRPYKTWLYPLPPIIFLLLIGWTLLFILKEKPVEALMGGLLVAGGAIFYGISKYFGDKNKATI